MPKKSAQILQNCCLPQICALKNLLMLVKAKIDFESKEFAVGLSFVAVSRVRLLNDVYFKQFTLERLQRIRGCSRSQERKNEEERLLSMT